MLELQRLRVQIESMLSGALRLQEREFQALPEAWQKLDEAYGVVRWLVSPAQEYPNLDRMSPAELEEFFANSELTVTQKDRIRSSSERVDAYQQVIFWHRLHRVKAAIADLQGYTARNGIFLPHGLKEKLNKVCTILWSAAISKEIGHEARDYKIQSEGWKKVEEEAKPLYEAIEGEIQARLHSHSRGGQGI